jgi:uncharacterized protein (UPF0332 family)
MGKKEKISFRIKYSTGRDYSLDQKLETISAMIQKAKEKLLSAQILFRERIFDDSVSRAYYAIFHAMTAALYSKDLTFSSHSQTIGKFNKEFIHSGIFEKSFSKEIHFIFDKREAGDYDIDNSIDEPIAARCISFADRFILCIEFYLTKSN